MGRGVFTGVESRERAPGADLGEIERVYRERFRAFVRTATAILGDAEAGRDAVQDAFATAVRRRAAFRGEGTLEGWLWRTVVNTARSARRTRGRAATATAEHEASWNGGFDDPDAAAVRALLAELPERQRLAVFLRYFADLDYRAIGEALEIQPGTVAATLHAAHATVRRRLEVPS